LSTGESLITGSLILWISTGLSFGNARLSLTHTVLSKRKLIKLVKDKYVRGWDDPRLPTINGLRRRGFSSEGINKFCDDIRVTRNNSLIPIEKLEEFIRQDLNSTSRRCFAIFDPIKVRIKNWNRGNIDVICPNVPGKDASGTHTILFCGTFYLERDDFREHDEPDYYGLALNSEKSKFVKLKYVDVDIKLVDIVRDRNGNATELIVEHDSKATTKHAIHWISIEGEGKDPLKAEIRNYDHLFSSEEPIKTWGDNWLKDINSDSLEIKEAIVDPSCASLKPYDRIQFERVGYYCVDPDSTPEKLVFNRTVTLKESTWKKKKQ